MHRRSRQFNTLKSCFLVPGASVFSGHVVGENARPTFETSSTGDKDVFRSTSFSSPEAALLLVSTKNRDLWPCQSRAQSSPAPRSAVGRRGELWGHGKSCGSGSCAHAWVMKNGSHRSHHEGNFFQCNSAII